MALLPGRFIRHFSLATTSSSSLFKSIVHSRKTCPRFLPEQTIEEPVLKDILETTLRSPSSFNLQPTQIIVVQDPKVKEQLANDAMLGKGNQFRTKDCSALVVFLADLEPDLRIERIMELEERKRHPNYTAIFPVSTSFLLGQGHLATLVKQISTRVVSSVMKPMPTIDPVLAWSYKNTSLYGQTFLLACTSHGLATSIMEGFDAPRLCRTLLVPQDRYAVPFVVAVGIPFTAENGEDDSTTPRLPLSDMVFRESFGVPFS